MRLLISVVLAALASVAGAQDRYEFWPGADYNESVPTVEQVTGHESGERITWHADVIRYFEALQMADPARVQVHR